MLYVLGEYLGKLQESREILYKSIDHCIDINQYDGVFRGSLFLQKINNQLFDKQNEHCIQITNIAYQLTQKSNINVNEINMLRKYQALFK